MTTEAGCQILSRSPYLNFLFATPDISPGKAAVSALTSLQQSRSCTELAEKSNSKDDLQPSPA